MSFELLLRILNNPFVRFLILTAGVFYFYISGHMFRPQFAHDYSSSSMMGYTTPQTLLIKINRKFFDDFDIAHVAGNLTHEWTHKLGFDHLWQ
jgi:hypothetical protein